MKKIACAAIAVLFIGACAAFSAPAAVTQGLVINATADYIEVKKGRKEMALYWTEATAVTMNGAKADRNAVTICQKVKASYTVKDGRKLLVSLDILKDSYCFR